MRSLAVLSVLAVCMCCIRADDPPRSLRNARRIRPMHRKSKQSVIDPAQEVSKHDVGETEVSCAQKHTVVCHTFAFSWYALPPALADGSAPAVNSHDHKHAPGSHPQTQDSTDQEQRPVDDQCMHHVYWMHQEDELPADDFVSFVTSTDPRTLGRAMRDAATAMSSALRDVQAADADTGANHRLKQDGIVAEDGGRSDPMARTHRLVASCTKQLASLTTIPGNAAPVIKPICQVQAAVQSVAFQAAARPDMRIAWSLVAAEAERAVLATSAMTLAHLSGGMDRPDPGLQYRHHIAIGGYAPDIAHSDQHGAPRTFCDTALGALVERMEVAGKKPRAPLLVPGLGPVHALLSKIKSLGEASMGSGALIPQSPSIGMAACTGPDMHALLEYAVDLRAYASKGYSTKHPQSAGVSNEGYIRGAFGLDLVQPYLPVGQKDGVALLQSASEHTSLLPSHEWPTVIDGVFRLHPQETGSLGASRLQAPSSGAGSSSTDVSAGGGAAAASHGNLDGAGPKDSELVAPRPPTAGYQDTTTSAVNPMYRGAEDSCGSRISERAYRVTRAGAGAINQVRTAQSEPVSDEFSETAAGSIPFAVDVVAGSHDAVARSRHSADTSSAVSARRTAMAGTRSAQSDIADLGSVNVLPQPIDRTARYQVIFIIDSGVYYTQNELQSARDFDALEEELFTATAGHVEPGSSSRVTRGAAVAEMVPTVVSLLCCGCVGRERKPCNAFELDSAGDRHGTKVARLSARDTASIIVPIKASSKVWKRKDQIDLGDHGGSIAWGLANVIPMAQQVHQVVRAARGSLYRAGSILGVVYISLGSASMIDKNKGKINRYLQILRGLGFVAIAAAGNTGVDASDVFPCSSPHTICVGAYGGGAATKVYLEAFSNWGQVVGIFADGEDPPRQRMAREYGAQSGETPGILARSFATSYAAPRVACALSQLAAEKRIARVDGMCPLNLVLENSGDRHLVQIPEIKPTDTRLRGLQGEDYESRRRSLAATRKELNARLEATINQRGPNIVLGQFIFESMWKASDAVLLAEDCSACKAEDKVGATFPVCHSRYKACICKCFEILHLGECLPRDDGPNLVLKVVTSDPSAAGSITGGASGDSSVASGGSKYYIPPSGGSDLTLGGLNLQQTINGFTGLLKGDQESSTSKDSDGIVTVRGTAPIYRDRASFLVSLDFKNMLSFQARTTSPSRSSRAVAPGARSSYAGRGAGAGAEASGDFAQGLPRPPRVPPHSATYALQSGSTKNGCNPGGNGEMKSATVSVSLCYQCSECAEGTPLPAVVQLFDGCPWALDGYQKGFFAFQTVDLLPCAVAAAASPPKRATVSVDVFQSPLEAVDWLGASPPSKYRSCKPADDESIRWFVYDKDATTMYFHVLPAAKTRPLPAGFVWDTSIIVPAGESG